MELSDLSAISPIDGRYRRKTASLAPYFSEYGLIRYRIWVEIQYFIALCELPLPQLEDFPKKEKKTLEEIIQHFDQADAQRVKEIEHVTNHDVKAVEYFLKEIFKDKGWEEFSEFIHFGLTSQDVTNTAVPASIKDAMRHVYYPHINELVDKLVHLAETWKKIPMLARTHGQPASPTRLGKEFHVFVERLKIQLNCLHQVPLKAKFGGATGNFNAHHVAYPDIDWIEFADRFIEEKCGLQRSRTTTQIEHYDHLAGLLDNLKRINIILIDLARDLWTYISMDYFKQKIEKGEVGSSAMPHKVNPIDFENAEGNLGVANAWCEHLAQKLPISRLQRDLTDSTVLRNIGLPFAHTILACQSLLKGLSKLVVNEEKIRADLDDNWVVIAEAIQTILRREKYPEPYEKLKELTRKDQKTDKESIQQFIRSLDLPESVKKELLEISPFNYTGI